MIRRTVWGAACVAAGLMAGCASHQRALPPPDAVAAPAVSFAGQSPQRVSLEGLSVDMPPGTHIGEARFGYSNSCGEARPMTYKHGDVKLARSGYAAMFREVMEAAGVPVEEAARFAGQEVEKADIHFAATIRDLALNVCFPNLRRDQDYAVGEAYVRAEWSLFSPTERKVLQTVTTEGRTPPKMTTRLSDDGLIAEALRQSLQRALQLPQVAGALTDKRGATVARQAAAPAKAFANAPRISGGLGKNLDRVRGSVATVYANAGQGSGFAVGSGDHVLTAAHVVSGSKFVKLTTFDGKQHYGEVIRSNAVRDLALIRLDGGALKPLSIAPSPPTEGSEVFAVGSPLGEKFSMSVTKGVVSGMRNEAGSDYLQSDVNVLPGSSGGPLLDGDGNVVGMAVGGVALGRVPVPVGMNFFTPGADLLKFLEGR